MGNCQLQRQSLMRFQVNLQGGNVQRSKFYVTSLASNREFAARLQERKVPYEFHEMQGAHTWDFWDAAILRFLNTLSEHSFTAKASPGQSSAP